MYDNKGTQVCPVWPSCPESWSTPPTPYSRPWGPRAVTQSHSHFHTLNSAMATTIFILTDVLAALFKVFLYSIILEICIFISALEPLLCCVYIHLPSMLCFAAVTVRFPQRGITNGSFLADVSQLVLGYVCCVAFVGWSDTHRAHI